MCRLVVLAALVFALPAHATPMFTGLGALPGATVSVALGVSSDGSVVVGYSSPGSGGVPGFRGQAFRWTAAGGMVGLPGLPGTASSSASDVSDDGTVIVGSSGSDFAVRWTASQPTALGFLPTDPGYAFQSYAEAASADGSVVVGGSSSGSSSEAYRWTSAGGMIGLGYLPGAIQSAAADVSADGSIVVGSSQFPDPDINPFFVEPFRWSAGTGMVGIGQLPGANMSFASGVSADGSVVVGQSAFFNFSGGGLEWNRAFRWTEATGILDLGALSGDIYSSASATSADGSVIVGLSSGSSSGSVGRRAFIWDPAHGMRSLSDVLVDDYGLDLTGWTLDSATAITEDGGSIVGYGVNPSGQQEAWMATIPEPGTALLLAIGVFGLARLSTIRGWRLRAAM